MGEAVVAAAISAVWVMTAVVEAVAFVEEEAVWVRE